MAFANGEARDDSSEACINRCMARYGLAKADTLEMISEVVESFSPNETDAVAAVLKNHALVSRGFILLDSYVKHHGDKVMAERCLWALLDYPELSGANSVQGLADLLGYSKQRVNKCLKYFQARIPELPLLLGQRNENGRDNMAAAQKLIWHGRNGNGNGH